MSAFAAESPMEAKRPHLNPGFKVVFVSIGMAEDAFLIATRGSPRVADKPAPRRGFCLLWRLQNDLT